MTLINAAGDVDLVGILQLVGRIAVAVRYRRDDDAVAAGKAQLARGFIQRQRLNFVERVLVCIGRECDVDIFQSLLYVLPVISAADDIDFIRVLRVVLDYGGQGNRISSGKAQSARTFIINQRL